MSRQPLVPRIHWQDRYARASDDDTRVEWLDRSDDAIWDQFVEAHPHGTVCQTTRWRDAIERGFSHIRGRILAVRDGDGPIRSGLAVYDVRSWMLGNRVVSVPFSSRVDPLVSRQADLVHLVRFLEQYRVESGSLSLQIRLSREGVPRLPNVAVNRRLKRHYLPLLEGVETLWRHFHASSVRRRIQKADREGLALRQGRRGRDLEVLHRIYAQTRQRLRLPAMPRVFFEALTESLEPDEWELLVVERDGEPLSAGFFLIFNGVQQLEWSGDTAEGRRRNANQKLYWAGIRAAAERGCHTFCFGRTDPGNTGLMEYKRRWGSLEEDIVLLESGPRAGRGRARPDRGLLRRTAQQLIASSPRPLYQRFSSFCYRHLG